VTGLEQVGFRHGGRWLGEGKRRQHEGRGQTSTWWFVGTARRREQVDAGRQGGVCVHNRRSAMQSIGANVCQRLAPGDTVWQRAPMPGTSGKVWHVGKGLAIRERLSAPLPNCQKCRGVQLWLRNANKRPRRVTCARDGILGLVQKAAFSGSRTRGQSGSKPTQGTAAEHSDEAKTPRPEMG
jgi:hypothetical protein